ncbi:MAG: hypothetical protein ABIP27_09590 [Flavobacterium circumlabens]|uniref:hypothetical protein n=1 Tax=Flavobacterium circumlabens TaxID=2133765 RepID=UPI00326477D1
MDYTFFKIGFELNLITKHEIISFSEKEIGNDSHDYDFHLDIISLSKDSESIKFIEIFNGFNSAVEKEMFFKVHPVFINFIFRERDWFKQVNLILRYYNFFSLYLDETDYEFWSRLKDDFSLRRDGFVGCMEMPIEMISHFNKELEKKFSGTFFENLITCLQQ